MKIAVLGPSGRMGGRVAELIAAAPDLAIAALADRAASPLAGAEICGHVVGTDVGAALEGADVYIDFTTPASTREAAATAERHRTAAVIGTTGLDAGDEAAIEALAKVAPVLTAANFSLGVNLLIAMAETAARALGADYDAEVVELHHKRKRDAPSGTALALGAALARGRDADFTEVSCTARQGDVGPRRDGEIGLVAVRGGDIVGEHIVYLIGETERIELTHRASDRSLFARGAIRAARWLAGRAPGRYQMADVLGLTR